MRICVILVAALATDAAADGGALPRAASLDFCADQYLLALADPSQIVALSPGADEADSFMREKAKGLRIARPSAEEIGPLKPDIVLRFWGGSAGVAPTLERFGARVLTLDYPSDFNVVRKNIEIAAAALHRVEEGDRVLADLDRRLAALGERRAARPLAVYVTPGGVTAGAGTIINAIIEAAGGRNAAAEAGQSGWPTLPAETLVLHPPELIVTGFFSAATEYVNHWSAARHPVLRRVFATTPTINLDADLISCPAWFSVEAAEEIAARIDAMEGALGDAD